jgi:tetratricopeptide (TPR) repeat protein/transcriptional regulator with XRE-family HTH domain
MINEGETTFGGALRELRLAAGHSQESLARISGVSPREVSYLETGKIRCPHPATVNALARALNAGAELRLRLDRPARTAAEAAPRAPVPCQLPSVTPHLIGLDDQLDRAAGKAAEGGAIAVCGMPGVGKTTFAIRLGRRLRASFPDGQLFADLHGFDERAASPEQVLGFLIRSLQGNGGHMPAGVEERAALLRSILSGRRVLLVLDNARDERQLRPLLPASDDCAAVVTSRNALGGLDVRHRVQLGVLNTADAISLLALIAGDDRIRAEPGRARELADACGGLPLALRIVAARLAIRPGLTAADLAGRLADQRGRICQLAIGDTAVDSAFYLSYRMLADREKLVFRRLGLNPVPGFGVTTAAVLADLPEDQTAGILDALADANLLEPGGPGSRYRMHDLLRLYARSLTSVADPEARSAIDRLSAWYVIASRAAARLVTPAFAVLPDPPAAAVGSVPAVCRVAAPAPGFGTAQRAAAWLEAERPAIVAMTLRSAQLGSLPLAWLLADVLRGYFFSSRDTEDWVMTARAGLAAARRARDRTATAAMLISLGQARASRCQYGLAISHYRQAASQAQEWPDGRSTALGNLGIVYYLLGQLEQAQHYYRLALEVSRLTGNRQMEAVRLGNLAGVCRAACAFPEALRHYTDALAVYRELGNRHGEALTACNYAHTCRDLGRTAEAIALSDSALVIARQLRSRLAEAIAQYTRAGICLDLGRHDDALRAAHRAVACGQDLGDEVIESNSLNALGEVERSRGDTVGAAGHHAGALVKARNAGFRLGEVEALVGLARTALADGRPDEAGDYAGQAEHLAAASKSRLAERQVRACRQSLAR